MGETPGTGSCRGTLHIYAGNAEREWSWPYFNVLLQNLRSWDSIVGIVTSYRLDNGGVKNFLFSMSSRLALGSTQPPIQWVPGALSLGVKRPGCEADHSPPASAEVKKM
jgi:hypothetical protein